MLLKAIKSEEKDNEILELIEEKNRLQEEVKLQQDNQLRELQKEKKSLEVANTIRTTKTRKT